MSTYTFYDIKVRKDGTIEYEWMCEVCGTVTLNKAENHPPDECHACQQIDEETDNAHGC